MPVLRIRTRSGHVSDLAVDELLTIDGAAWRLVSGASGDAGDDEALRDRVARLEGRVGTLEQIFTRVVEADGPGEDFEAAATEGATPPAPPCKGGESWRET